MYKNIRLFTQTERDIKYFTMDENEYEITAFRSRMEENYSFY